MTANLQRRDDTPPDLEEGYWEALLREGEFAEGIVLGNGDHREISEDRTHRIDLANNGGAQHLSDWDAITQIKEHDEVLELAVTGYNRGGLLVEWHTLRGFVPASQLIDFPAVNNEAARKRLLEACVGRTLSLRVIELNELQNRLILSERAASASPGERADILSRLQSGDIVEGVVTNLCDFGAFVDLGGLEGLIHISELSWGRVGHPSEILSRGQQVRAAVLDVNADAGRVALSYKRLHPDPWETVALRYTVGETVEGIITNVVDFGAFARIEEGLEGLIHVSELAEGHFLHPRNVVTEGQQIHARILSIDGHARRLGLSLRSLL
ncbi:MAG: S1 RNA-binding domain-containing protein [Anaerolineae bacterium]|nr:S1 RNA-binding domain-containing protein [Anaerolineae bacterium]